MNTTMHAHFYRYLWRPNWLSELASSQIPDLVAGSLSTVPELGRFGEIYGAALPAKFTKTMQSIQKINMHC